MTSMTGNEAQPHWSETSGLTHLLGVFRLAVHPEKLLLALVGIVLTICWGFILDRVWTATGNGIDPNEVTAYVAAPAAALPDEAGASGVFEVFNAFETACIRDAVESVRYGRFIGPVRAGESVHVAPLGVGPHAVRGAFANVVLMGRGVAWLITRHFLYALLFLPVLFAIWGIAGGAICRIAAVQFAREERVALSEALRFAKEKLIGGFVTAPLIPLALCLVIGLLLLIGGMFLTIPWLGDVVAGVLFCLALIGGFLIALILVGTVAGGSFFFPTIAVEGSDGFDAVSRSFSYVVAKPLRVIWYAMWLTLFGSFGWLLVMFIGWLTAASTHVFVGIGSGIFASREGVPDKLTALWAPPTFENLHAFSGAVQGSDWIAAGLIGLWVVVLSALVWSFLISFYFSGSTVAYYLTRRDVDGTDLAEIELEEDEEPPADPAPAPGESAGGGGVSLPVVNADQ